MQKTIVAALKSCVAAARANKKLIVGGLKYAAGLGLLAFVLIGNWKDISEAVQRPLNPVPLIVAVLLTVPSLLLTFIRWFVLVRAQDLPFTLANALRLGLVGFFFNTSMPGSVGGDIIKAIGIARAQSRRTVAVATVMIDRLVGVWGLCWLVALLGSAYWIGGNEAINANRSLQGIVVTAVAIDALSLVAWSLLGLLPEWRISRFAGRLERIPKVGHSFAEFWRALCMYRQKRWSIMAALLLSVFAQVGFVVLFYNCAQVFSMPHPELAPLPSLGEQFLIAPIGFVVEALVPTPGGMGGGEFSFGQLFGILNPLPGNQETFDQMVALGTLASLVKRMINWGVGLVGYLVYLRMKPSLPTADLTVESPSAPGEEPSLARS